MEIRPASSFCIHLRAPFKETTTYAFIIKAEALGRVLDHFFFLGVRGVGALLFIYLPTYLAMYLVIYFSVLLQRSLSYMFLNTSLHALQNVHHTGPPLSVGTSAVAVEDVELQCAKQILCEATE